MRYARWLFWNVAYLFRKTPTDLEGYVTMLNRRRKPWGKFKPFVFHNRSGRQWEIYFSDDPCRCRPGRSVACDVLVSFGTGRVVGLTIWEGTLRGHDDPDRRAAHEKGFYERSKGEQDAMDGY